MKDEISNIINLEGITRVRNSMSLNGKLPTKNTLVKLIPLEYLERGVKVLINGKLFIAFIDGKIPIKEEIIAYVNSASPISLSLNLSSKNKKDERSFVDQILKKFALKDSAEIRNTIKKVIEEGNILIKSKILLLSEMNSYIKADGLEYLLLMNLVWNNNDKNRNFIEELYDELFNETFENVCNNLFASIKNLLFLNLPQFISQKIRDSLIYNEKKINTDSLTSKVDQTYCLIKQFNEIKDSCSQIEQKQISDFVTNGAKYILQKSVLKDYDYYPDFVIVNRNSELSVIHYSIKKIYTSNNQKAHKILFKHEAIPFQISGILRDKFLVGNIEINEEIVNSNEVNSLVECLFDHWGFRSNLTKNDDQKNNLNTSKINIEVNKLVS